MTTRPVRPSWKARAGLLAIGVILVVLVELIATALLTLLPPSHAPDDGFAAQVPPFIRERAPDGREMWVVHPARRHSFNTESFPVNRADGSLLVFCLGGSSVYGYPHGAEFAFPHRLEDSLRSLDTGREIDVVNLGGMSYGSERLRLLTRQLMVYRPNVVVVYTGHNEFIERDIARAATASRAPDAVSRPVGKLALYRLAERLLARLRPPPTGTTDSVFGIDVQRREMRAIQQNEVSFAADLLGRNIREIVRIANDHGAVPVVCTVASNLAHWRPENSAMATDLAPVEVIALASLLARARSLVSMGEHDTAVQELEKAIALDPGYAAASFDTARLLFRIGRYQRAQELFEAAREHDPTPIRAPAALNAAVRRSAATESVELVDVEESMKMSSEHGIPGADLFLDYCHPNARGHELIGQLLLAALARELDLPSSEEQHVSPIVAEQYESEPGDDGFALWWEGNVELRQGRPWAAEELLRRAVELKPSNERPLVSLSQALKAQGRLQESIEVAQRAVELNPSSVMALNSLAVLLGLGNRSEEALETLERALALDPEASSVHVNLGAEYLRRRQPEEALHHLSEAVRLHPNMVGAHRNMGLAHLLRDDNAAAAVAFLEELRRNPFDSRAAARLAESAAQIGQTEIAEEASELARLLEPG